MPIVPRRDSSVRPAPRPAGPAAWLVCVGALGVALLQGGCDLSAVDRVNHLHSDANQKTAEEALGSFEKFASDQTGLAPTLLKNLRSQSAHSREADVLRVAVDEDDLTIGLTGKTWNGLRRDLYSGLGVIERSDLPPPVPNAPPPPIPSDVYVKWQRKLDVRVRTRYRKVQAVGAVLKALGLGQEALILQANENLAGILRELGQRQPTAPAAVPDIDADATPADQARARGERLANTLFGFRDAVIAAGREAVLRRERLDQAEALQSAILRAVENSRDKATAFALVALIGTGLTDRSTRQLDDFIRALEGRLDAVRVPAGAADAPAWKEFSAAAENAKALVKAARLLDDYQRLRTASKTGADVSPDEVRTLHDLMAQAGLAAPPLTDVDSPRGGAGGKQAVATYLDRLDAAIEVWFGGGNAMTRLAAELPAIGDRVSQAVNALREKIDKLPPSVLGKDLSAVVASLKGGDPTGAALQYLHKALAANPALLDRLEKISKDPEASKRFDADLKQLGSILTDIGTESVLATNRVLEFLRDLYRLQLDLDEENLRHYRGLSSVASQELKRWELLSKLNGRYRGYFADVRRELEDEDDAEQALRRDLARLGITPPTRPRSGSTPGPATAPAATGPATPPARKPGDFRLFPDPGDVSAWNALIGDEVADDKLRQTIPAAARHVEFGPDRQVLSSVRLLAETARAWQFGSPRLDPSGRQTHGSNVRLFSAIELINGQLLMVSLNERFSLENGLTLRTEIQEHDVHLDAIAARTREAGIRLGLRDMVAFHSSGITEADIQATIGIIQQVLLARIGSKL